MFPGMKQLSTLSGQKRFFIQRHFHFLQLPSPPPLRSLSSIDWSVNRFLVRLQWLCSFQLVGEQSGGGGSEEHDDFYNNE